MTQKVLTEFDFSPLPVRQRTLSWTFIIGWLLFFIIFLAIVLKFNSLLVLADFAWLLFFPIIVVGIINQVRYETKKRSAIIEFAARNNLDYYDNLTDLGPGSLFKHGHSQRSKNVVSGLLQDLPFYFYEYQYAKGSGKNKRSYDATVMEVTLPRKLPHMVIDSLVEPGNYLSSTLPIQFDQSQRIDLEGNFHKSFALYAPDKYGVTALSIIAPDVMETLLKHAAMCDIEIIDDKLYFYWPDVAMDGKSVEKKFMDVQAILLETYSKLTQSNVFAHTSQAALHSTAANGTRLKTVWWTPAVISLVIIFVAAMAAVFTTGQYGQLVGWIIAFGALHSLILYVYKKRIYRNYINRQ